MKNKTTYWEVLDERNLYRRIPKGGPFRNIFEAWKSRRGYLKQHKNCQPRCIFVNKSEIIDGVRMDTAVN